MNETLQIKQVIKATKSTIVKSQIEIKKILMYNNKLKIIGYIKNIEILEKENKTIVELKKVYHQLSVINKYLGIKNISLDNLEMAIHILKEIEEYIGELFNTLNYELTTKHLQLQNITYYFDNSEKEKLKETYKIEINSLMNEFIIKTKIKKKK